MHPVRHRQALHNLHTVRYILDGMERAEVVASLILSAHALARIAAQDAGNEAPSAQWRVLSILEDSPPVRIGDLARAARTTQPGTTRLVGELERAGLVSRQADPQDSRATLVSVTDAGRRALADWRIELRTTLAPRFADVTDSDWLALERAAELLRAHSIEHPTTGEQE